MALERRHMRGTRNNTRCKSPKAGHLSLGMRGVNTSYTYIYILLIKLHHRHILNAKAILLIKLHHKHILNAKATLERLTKKQEPAKRLHPGM